jgi:hypothetical protein
MANVVDGFHICRSGFDLIRIQRTEEINGNIQECKSGRTAFLEYNDIRKEVLHSYNKQKERLFNVAIKQESSKCNIV